MDTATHPSLTAGLNTTLGLGAFLQTTPLPPWFPLANTSGQQQLLLESLGMRKDHRGHVVPVTGTSAVSQRLPMAAARSVYSVIVLGGGIAGLSAALETFRLAERQGIAVQVTVVEARDRVGGRLWTDRESFVLADGSTNFPVDLGAGWIHGIDMNPLASLAKEAGLDFVTTSEEVTMLDACQRRVNADKDERAGKLFDKLLDLAVEDCWKSTQPSKVQSAVRWYGRYRTAQPLGVDRHTQQLTHCIGVVVVNRFRPATVARRCERSDSTRP
jgi:hypothetical protein